MSEATETDGAVVPPEERGSVGYVVLVTIVAALGGLLFGYDTAVISGAIGLLQTYFHLDPEFGAGWAAASALIGCAVGAGCAGLLGDRLGRKRVLILSAIAFFVSALGTAFPMNFIEFVAFRIVGGLGIGAASVASPMYIAEIAPARLRGRLVSVNQLAIVSGMLIVYFVNYFIALYGARVDDEALAAAPPSVERMLEPRFVSRFIGEYGPTIEREKIDELLTAHAPQVRSEQVAEFLTQRGYPVDARLIELASIGGRSWNVDRGWRWMFGAGALPALLLLVMVFSVPESPRWLVEQRRRGEAFNILARINGETRAGEELFDIEAAVAADSGSFRQLLELGVRRALVIGVALAVLQQATGINVFIYFAPEIFKKLGSQIDAALLQTVVVGAVNLAFTLVAIGAVDRIGRKPLLLLGSAGMCLSLTAMGAAAYFQRTEPWFLVCMLAYIACFAASTGPVTWVVLSEIFPTHIRGRAMAIATIGLWTANYVITQTFPILNENRWLVDRFNHGFTFWVYGGVCLAQIVFVAALVPETKGKSLEEIERSWLHKTTA